MSDKNFVIRRKSDGKFMMRGQTWHAGPTSEFGWTDRLAMANIYSERGVASYKSKMTASYREGFEVVEIEIRIKDREVTA